MKTLFLITLLAISQLALAAPESVLLHCDGIRRKIGGADRAPVVVALSTQGQYTYGSPWLIDFSFGDTVFAGAAVGCGAPLPEGLSCSDERSNARLPFPVQHFCGDSELYGGYTRYPFETSVVFDPTFKFGRFYCSYLGHSSQSIELTNCHRP